MTCKAAIRVFALLATVLAMLDRANATDIAVAEKAACYDIEASIDLLVEYTDTACLPGGTDKTPSSLSLIVIADQPVFTVGGDTEKAWLIAVIAASGHYFREHEDLVPGTLAFADVSLMKTRRAYFLPLEIAKKLQADISSGTISLDAGWSIIVQKRVLRSFDP